MLDPHALSYLTSTEIRKFIDKYNIAINNNLFLNIFPKGSSNMPYENFANIFFNVFEINDISSLKMKDILVPKLVKLSQERYRKLLVNRTIRNKIQKKINLCKKKILPDIDYEKVKSRIPYNMSPAHAIKRRQIFRKLDADNNRYLTLDECLRGVESEFKYKESNNDFSIIKKAYHMSCKIRNKLPDQKKTIDDECVDYYEFRTFLKLF